MRLLSSQTLSENINW